MNPNQALTQFFLAAVPAANSIWLAVDRESGDAVYGMRDLVRLIVWMVVDLFRSRAALEAEIWMLRQQINVLRRTAPKKQTFSSIDRLIFVGLYRLRPGVRDALAIVKPETVVKWHRAGFRLYWRWKSKARGGRPTVPSEIRKYFE